MQHSSLSRLSAPALLEVSVDIFRGIFKAFSRIDEACIKSRKVSLFWAMTDAELAARGLRREDIVRLVMADVI